MQKLWSTEIGRVFLESFYFGAISDFRVSIFGNQLSLSSPPILSLPSRLSPSRPPFAGGDHGHPATSGLMAGLVRRVSSPSSYPDRHLGEPWPELPGVFPRSSDGGEMIRTSWVSTFRPNWPVNLHGSGSPPSQEPSATGPDQIHGRTAPEIQHVSGDPYRLSRMAS